MSRAGAERLGAPPVVAALDIGGTKLAAAIIDADGQVLARSQTPTQTGTNQGRADEELFERLTALLDSVIRASPKPPKVIGVGCGGPMASQGQTVSPLNIGQWRAFPLRARLLAHYQLPTFIDNDAKALARAEGWLGAARGETNYLAMVVSTGVGAGIVLNGQLLEGGSGNAGHIGHVIVEPQGQACACGARGCLEAEVSGTAIAKLIGRPAQQAPPELRRRSGLLVGRAVASVANLLDLRLAVVAGSVALGFGDDFFQAAQQELDRSARLDFSAGVRIVPTGCADLGPLLGAAAVARAGWV